MDVTKVLGDRLLIKPLEEKAETELGIIIPVDESNLPIATVVMVSKELEEKISDGHCPVPGERVYYIHNARQPGRVRHGGADHYIVGIGQIAAIV